jgi:5'-nucleotidase
MRILLTNDDGIKAQGILALHEALKDRYEVFVVAPLRVQSATGHGVTFDRPLRVRAEQIGGLEGYAVDGRPADCVKVALRALWPEMMGEPGPDLVVSGINHGANLGINVIYSGTVAAALEAGINGVPAIAFSLLYENLGLARWDVAARHARETLDLLLAGGPLAPHDVLSVNLPLTESDGPCPPILVAPANEAAIRDRYEKATSPGGHLSYWPVGHGLDFEREATGSDVELVKGGAIAVTPLHFDLTAHTAIGRWRDRLQRSGGSR